MSPATTTEPTSTPPSADRRSLAERLVDRVTRTVRGRDLSRRSLLQRAALVGAALTVDPTGFLLRPRTAYATVCGSSSSCSGGYTAFCCTINDGANTCPPDSYVAGWWKVDDSAFCNGAARYYLDCNDVPGSTTPCRCADGPCDERRTSCNVFRYGQCNVQVPGVTAVTCRIVTCTPPWVWDPACSTTVRTDPNTRTHSATCLPGENPTAIAIRYQDLGLAGSVLGRQTREERSIGGGVRRADYDAGVLVATDLGAHYVLGAAVAAWDAAGGRSGAMGVPTDDTTSLPDDAAWTPFTGGRVFASAGSGVAVPAGDLLDGFDAGGGARALGVPTAPIAARDGGWQVLVTAAAWLVVRRDADGEVRVLTADVELPTDGSWPATAQVVRHGGSDRYATGVLLSREGQPDGASVAFVATGLDFPDSLVAGAPAGILGAPVLLTSPERLVDEVRDELVRLAPDDVVLLGGEQALGRDVARAVATALPDARVERLAGRDRYATSAQVATRFQNLLPARAGETAGTTADDGTAATRAAAGTGPRTVQLAVGTTFADALASVPGAVASSALALLTASDELPAATRRALAELRPERAVVLGGEAAIGASVERELRAYVDEVQRVAGRDRWATAVAAQPAEAASATGGTVVVASGRAFPDGLAAGPFAAGLGASLLLVEPDAVPAAVDAELRRRRPERIVVVGGERAIGTTVATQLAGYAAAPPTPSPG